MRYTYYPGCSLHATGVAYDKSMRAIFAKLGAELNELEDWNCCGATAYMSVQKTVAFAVSARNLALAERTGDDVIAPCSACYYALKHTREGMANDPELRAQVDEALAAGGLEAELTVSVRHPLEVLLSDVGIEKLVAAQTRSLEEFRPACYYGCQIVRPLGAVPEEDPELPMSMERLFTALGARPVDYPPKVRCCGGMLVATFPEVATKLSTDLVEWAIAREANCIVTVCPLCQSNLDLINLVGNGNGKSRTPVLYFTQLVGLAIGCTPEEVGMQHGLVPVSAKAPPLTRSPESPTLAGAREV